MQAIWSIPCPMGIAVCSKTAFAVAFCAAARDNSRLMIIPYEGVPR